MKTKKMKLALNKRTVSNLENKQMKAARGGAFTVNCDTIADCVTWGGGSCPQVCYSESPPEICKLPLSYWYTDCLC